jgi:hypothetical protein
LLFAAYGFEVIGFDFAPCAINDANTLLSNPKKIDLETNIKFLQRDIFELPQEFPSYFDYVLEHTCFCAIDPEARLAELDAGGVSLYPELVIPSGKKNAIDGNIRVDVSSKIKNGRGNTHRYRRKRRRTSIIGSSRKTTASKRAIASVVYDKKRSNERMWDSESIGKT